MPKMRFITAGHNYMFVQTNTSELSCGKTVTLKGINSKHVSLQSGQIFSHQFQRPVVESIVSLTKSIF